MNRDDLLKTLSGRQLPSPITIENIKNEPLTLREILESLEGWPEWLQKPDKRDNNKPS